MEKLQFLDVSDLSSTEEEQLTSLLYSYTEAVELPYSWNEQPDPYPDKLNKRQDRLELSLNMRTTKWDWTEKRLSLTFEDKTSTHSNQYLSEGSYNSELLKLRETSSSDDSEQSVNTSIKTTNSIVEQGTISEIAQNHLQNEEENDALTSFFKAMEITVRGLSPAFQIKAKGKISALVTEFELKNFELHQNLFKAKFSGHNVYWSSAPSSTMSSPTPSTSGKYWKNERKIMH